MISLLSCHPALPNHISLSHLDSPVTYFQLVEVNSLDQILSYSSEPLGLFASVTGMESSYQELKANFTFQSVCVWIPAVSNIPCVAYQVTYYERMCIVILSKINVHVTLLL